MGGKAYLVIYNKRSDAYGFGDPLRVLGVVSIEDARRICSDPRTKWAESFLGWAQVRGQRIRPVRDDGRLREVAEDLGITVEWLA